LVLWVVPDNTRARRLYESEGWTVDGVSRDEEVLGVVVTEVRYRLHLT
jgi:RimJ/RimL family protein N-acetyltransferase